MAVKFDRNIAPGKTGAVTISVKMRNVQAPVTESATILSNDPTTPSLKLLTSYSVKRYISVTPWSFIRLTHVEGMKSTRAVRFETQVDGELELSTPQVEDAIKDKIETRLIRGEDHKSYVLEVSSSYAEQGTYKGHIYFHTNNPHKPDIRIPVVVVVSGPIRVTPPNVSFGTLNEDQARSQKRSVQLMAVEANDLKILGVEYDKSVLDVQVEDKTPGKEYLVNVSLNQEHLTKGKLEQKIVVKTNAPRTPDIEIPVRAFLLMK
ncbi:MAG: hypothetical protein HY788_20325 [Deltaproteobacteria bacterium]|nr:hypothetical protein [Deltaproteobacteria bacterium]